MFINPVIFFSLFGVTATCIVFLAYQQVMRYWAWYQERKRRLLLRNNPSALRNRIKEQERAIDHLQDETLKQRVHLDKLKQDRDDLRKEVRLLNKRNQFMANEMRYDPAAKTQVLRPMRSARLVEEYKQQYEEYADAAE